MADDGIQYLYDHQSDSEWAAIVLDDPEKIIKDYQEEEWPEVCLVVASTLGNLASDMIFPERNDDILGKSLKITRLGLNTIRLLESQNNREKNEKLRRYSAELYLSHAIALANKYRFISSFEFLRRAQFIFDESISSSQTESLQIKSNVMLFHCHGKNAEILLRMLDSIPQQAAADLIYYAEMIIVGAIDGLQFLNCE